MFRLNRNERSHWSGNGVHVESELVFMIGRNMHLIENHGPEALREASIYLEDIDPLMVKCCMIQLFHYFESRNTTPKTLSIVGIDTLSRRTKNIAYYAEKPPATAATVAA